MTNLEAQLPYLHKRIDTADISPRDAYSLLVHCVSPRPIAFVSSISKEGALNLAPFSFFMAGGANPPSVAFSPTANRSGIPKDTLLNIRETGEYVVNVVTYAIREPMNVTSIEYPHGHSEWESAGLTPCPSSIVQPPRVAESPIAMECRLFQIVPHGDGPAAACYVIGEVVCFHIAEDLYEDGAIDARRIDAIGRMSGDWYSRTHDGAMFALPRPTKP